MLNRRRRQLGIALRGLSLLIAVVIMGYFFHKNMPLIINWIATLGFFAPCLFLLLYCLMSIFCLPNLLLALAVGALFGFFNGFLLNLLGATLGAICGFSISRYLLPYRAARFEGPSRMSRLMRQVDKQGWKSVALLRLTPAIPFNLVNYGLGVTHIQFGDYIWATVIFLIPNKIILTYCGYAGVRLFS